MDLKTSAQQDLFRKLAKSKITGHQEPNFNGYMIEEYNDFKIRLQGLYENFEKELRFNLESNSGGLLNYLKGIQESLQNILNVFQQQYREDIHLVEQNNPELYQHKRLFYINNFFRFQEEIIYKTAQEISNNLLLVMEDPDLNTGKGSSQAILKRKVKSNLPKIDLVVLLWWLAEAKIFEFDGSHDNFVKFVEANFQYYDKSKTTYFDMKDVGPVMSKLFNDSPETNPVKSREELLQMLQNVALPPEKSILVKNKWNKV